jgi:hypothetical protein
MRLALQREEAALDELPVELGGGVEVVDHAAAELRHFVLQHLLAIDVVRDGARAVHLELRAHPLLAVEGGRGGIEAMVLVQLVLVDDLGAGRAHVGRGARLAIAVSAQQLPLDGDRESLVARHGVRIRRVQHDAGVAQRPRARIAGRLLADEAVLDGDAVVGIRVLPEQVAELPVEALVLVVAHFEQAVFHAEGIAEVVAQVVLGDLRSPAGEILAVEENCQSSLSASGLTTC